MSKIIVRIESLTQMFTEIPRWVPKEYMIVVTATNKINVIFLTKGTQRNVLTLRPKLNWQ